MKAALFLFLFTIPLAYVNSQTLTGIKKAVVLEYASDDVRSLGVTPALSSIKDKIRNDISDVEILDALSINEYENARISLHYDIFKDSGSWQYYGAVSIEVRRNVVDSRFTPPLFEPTVYKDYVYILLTNADTDFLRVQLDKYTETIIKDFARYYYLANPK